MPRNLTLRQIEAFKAVVENGSITRAADTLRVTQPAMSKLIAHMEVDTGITLFDRVRGRLAPTEHAMRLYGEVDRIFAGVGQVQSVVDAIRRETQGQLIIGVLPALAGSFMHRATSDFHRQRPNLICDVHMLASPWTVERVIGRTFDLGLVSGRIDNPHVTLVPLMEHALVCAIPLTHPLVEREVIEPGDLAGTAFVRWHPTESYIGRLSEELFSKNDIQPETVLLATSAPTVSECVAGGLGMTLVHPLMVSGFEGRIAVRRLSVDIPYSFQLCYSSENRNAALVQLYAAQLQATAAEITAAMLT